MIKLNITHPSYETKVPNFNKTVFTKGMTFKTKSVLNTNTINQSSTFNVLYNVVWDCISNKEVYNNDYEFFLKHTDWDDLIALLIGILNMTYTNTKDNISLNFTCPEPDAKNEDGICGKKYKASFKYANLMSNITLNEDTPDLFDKTFEYKMDEFNIKLELKYESLYTSLKILAIIEELNKPDCKAWKEFNIESDAVKSSIVSAISRGSSIFKIGEISSSEEGASPQSIELIYDLSDKECLRRAISYGSNLIELGNIPDDEIDAVMNPNKTGLECLAEITCPKCKKSREFDLKEWIINAFLPSI